MKLRSLYRRVRGIDMVEVAPGVYVHHARRRVRAGTKMRMRGDKVWIGGRFR